MLVEYIRVSNCKRTCTSTLCTPAPEVFLLLLQLYTPHAPRPHNKASLCCITLQVAGCEPHNCKSKKKRKKQSNQKFNATRSHPKPLDKRPPNSSPNPSFWSHAIPMTPGDSGEQRTGQFGSLWVCSQGSVEAPRFLIILMNPPYPNTPTHTSRAGDIGGSRRRSLATQPTGGAAVSPCYDDAYCRVHSAAVFMACGSLIFHTSATPLSRGSSGLGALRSPWILSKTVRIWSAGDHLSFRIFKQMRPSLSTLGWYILVRNRTCRIENPNNNNNNNTHTYTRIGIREKSNVE